MSVLLLFGTLLVCLLIGVPIAISLGVSALTAIYFGTTLPLGIIVQKAFTSLDSFPLLAIPFFMLAGILMGKGGVSKRLLHLATSMVGWMTGGLSMVTIVACMFFAAISGSGPATVAAIGGFMIPAMIAKHYKPGFAASVPAAAGSIGVIIPPSIPFVIYGVTANVSVGDMFIAGIFPGMLIAVLLMVTAYIISVKNNYRPEDGSKTSGKEVFRALNDAKWALFIPVIILGGIYGGIFSPTEAAVVSVVYALIIGAFIYKELTWKTVYDSFIQTIIINSTTMIIICLSVSFAHFMTLVQLPDQISNYLTGLTTNPFFILIVINLLLLLVGMFIDTISAVVILTPVLLPIVTEFGVDPVHFGVILVANLAIGFVTPPVGVNLFVASTVGKVKFEKIVVGVLPLLVVMIFALFIITYVPALSMWLTEMYR
ncbi:C4-dicarboxylate transporter, DctM subunit [Halobacillus karajensis]|uniref:Neu5Ac permease n=1 Tax=Halobacillus karajensis TaxID=195088 RepID=A0A024P884_9BACI|nr:TRAP transporter large permease [Halobacillus karajensis]CDQ21238.1 Neu5Ac permease [Halobacillus karajensis]CDQ25314.1 Neu5Ac permease [Halobacillus karajensis]CDQ25963.1 Neu5Ac permease [Halobacillus karajensis]SEI09980.1 C4-dicarboxylate transporter, DctM subunit [Halobacillus karajensis]